MLADRGWLATDAAFVLASTAVALGAVATPGARARGALALVGVVGAGALALGWRLEASRAPGGMPALATLEGRVRNLARFGGTVHVELAGVRCLEPPACTAPAGVEIRSNRTVPGRPELAAAAPGDVVRARVRLRPVAGRRNPGGRDPSRRSVRRGVGAVGRLAHPALHARLERDAPGPWRHLHAARARWGDALVAAGPGGGLLRALALGDRADLDRAQRDAFARLGVSHLLAVSGLHLALVASAAFALVRRLLAGCARLAARMDVRRPALAAALVAAGAYALLAGWGVPVRRALVLLLALAVGVLLRRPTRRAWALAGASLWILAREPGALFELGAQLSFAASAALLLARREIEPQGTARRTRALREGLRASSGVLCVTSPLLALHGLPGAPLALVANLILVPWTAVCLLPAALLSVPLAALRAPGAALMPLEALARATLRGITAVAEALPHGPAQVPPAPSWLGLALLLGLCGLCVRRLRWRVACALAVATVLRGAPPPVVVPEPPRAVFLDVGQGDATLVQGVGAAILVDAGLALPDGADLGRSVVLPALAALGVSRLDLVVATHADLDHRGGLAAVLEALPVGALWLPRGAGSEEAFAALRELARRAGVRVLERGAGDPALVLGDLVVEPLWPPPVPAPDHALRPRAPSVTPLLSRNERSLVIRVGVAGRSVMLPGDAGTAAEQALLRAGVDLRADVLKLGHHGSRSASSAAWLEAVGPGVVVASAPCAGRFPMPHAEVVARAAALPTSLWWTGRDGALLVGLAPQLAVLPWGLPRSGCDAHVTHAPVRGRMGAWPPRLVSASRGSS